MMVKDKVTRMEKAQKNSKKGEITKDKEEKDDL